MTKTIIFLVLVALASTFYISRKQMSDQKKDVWATYVNKKTERDGAILAAGRDGSPIILDWSIRNVSDSDFYEKQSQMIETSVEAFTKVEMDFLKAHTDEALQDEHFKTLKPFFADGKQNVDWDAATQKMRDRIRAIYETKNEALSSDFVFIFVILKDQETNKQLGSAQFFIMPDYPDGDVRVVSIAVKPEHQRKGLGKLLMDSVINIIPETKRIFLSTRITNEGAISAYKKWGFTEDPHPSVGHFMFPDHWIHLEKKVGGLRSAL